MSRESRPRLQSGPKSGRFRCRSRERCSRWWPKRLPQQAWSKGLQRRLHGRVRPGRVADMEPTASGVCSGNGCPHGVAGLIALLHHVPQLVFHNASRASVIVPGVSRSIRPVPRNPHPLGGFFPSHPPKVHRSSAAGVPGATRACSPAVQQAARPGVPFPSVPKCKVAAPKLAPGSGSCHSDEPSGTTMRSLANL